MLRLPFRLKVPSKDNLTQESVTSWTTFAFHGLMHFDGTALHIEWGGTAATDVVEGVSVRSGIISLPPESVVIPVSRLRSVKLAGGWWRPRLELTGNDVTALAVVPSEAAGLVRFWVTRGDRRLAGELAAAMKLAARERLLASRADRLPSEVPTPPSGV